MRALQQAQLSWWLFTALLHFNRQLVTVRCKVVVCRFGVSRSKAAALCNHLVIQKALKKNRNPLKRPWKRIGIPLKSLKTHIEYARSMSETCQTYAKVTPELCQNYVRKMPGLCENCARNMPELCRSYARNMLELCQNHARTSSAGITKSSNRVPYFPKAHFSRPVFLVSPVAPKNIFLLKQALYNTKVLKQLLTFGPFSFVLSYENPC